jgi:hypothetical protein
MTASAPAKMITLPPDRTVEPFGKVNLRHEPDGRVWVRAYVLMERIVEGARTGIAIDGSGTMMPWFGVQRKGAPNIVSPFVQEMCAYLARKIDATGSTTAIYWATGDSGKDIEEIGTLTADDAVRHSFGGPRHYGNRTCLLPAIKYFVDHFSSAPWGLYVFISDGRLDDLEDVKACTIQLAREIGSGQRNDLKLVIIGVGRRIDEAQMVELDDLDTGTDLDLWDHKIADNMQHLAEVFTEVVDENVIVAPQGLIKDSAGNVVMDYRDTGVPALLEFVLPSGSTSFTLEIGENAVTQPLS